MRGPPLHIQQPPLRLRGRATERIDQCDERHLGRIARVMEHRLPREEPTNLHAVQAADQLPALPRLDGMRDA